MSAAPFSFHCVICINSFDLINRPPIVLPCGHTFICEPCSKRIDKCMECREPLFIKHNTTCSHITPQNDGQTYQGYTPRTPVSRRSAQANSSRYGTSPQPPQKKVEKIPLPLPRNLVLISLMEAASKRQLYANANLMDDSSDTDSIPNEDQVVLDAMDVLASACGTYAVREQYGLPLYKGSLGNSFHNVIDHGEITSRKPALILKYGQKVQVADAHEGVYTLARNAGTVFANSSQLVKVGVSKERSCKLEGIINSIQTSKAEISQRMNDLLQTESHLRSDLDYCLSQPPSHSVIEESEDTFPNELNDMAMTDSHGTRHRSLSSPSDQLTSSSFSSPIPSQDISGSTVFIGDESFATPTPASPTSMYNQSRKTPPMSTVSHVDPISPFSMRVMCGASLMPLFRNDDEEHERSALPIQRPSSEDSSGRNFETVDFRTGFSGHAALNKVRKSLQSTGRPGVRMMGQHGGVVPFRRGSKRPSSPIADKKTW